MFPWDNENVGVKPGRQLRQQSQASSTCPWGDAGGERSNSRESSKSRRSNLPPAHNTCPWGDAGSERSSSRSRRPPAQNTCPWGDSGKADSDSASLARADRLRQRPPVGYQGAAGSGAPRNQSTKQIGYISEAVSKDSLPAMHQSLEDSFPAQRDMPPSMPPRMPSRERNDHAGYDATSAQRDVSHADPVASELACDPDAQERADLIEKCLAHGLSDEEIEGVLREHMFQKMMEQEEKERAAAAHQAAAPAPQAAAPAPAQPAASSVASRLISKAQDEFSAEYKQELTHAQQAAPPPECAFEPRKPVSVAAKRQARANSLKSVSFGPSDEEIVGILEHGRTPSPQSSEPAAAQMKPGARDCHGATDARTAYLQAQQQAAASKNRNRGGQGIF